MSYQERIRPGGIYLGESLSGGLPTIDQLKIGLSDNLLGVKDPEDRAYKIPALTKYVRQGLVLNPEDNSEFVDPKRDVLSALFLDSVDYISWNHLLSFKKGARHNGSKEKFVWMYARQVQSRIGLRHGVDLYRDIFKSAPEPIRYEGLDTIMYDATCLVKNRSDIGIRQTASVHASLRGVLAESKILKGLHESGWEWARYADVNEDTVLKWDLAVPLIYFGGKGFVAIQVKSLSNEEAVFSISMGENDVLTIEVPMGSNTDRFSLSQEETECLNQAIRQFAPVYSR